MKILVVDDDESVIGWIQDALIADNFTVEVAASAQEALDLLEFYPFDLALLDIGLPDLDGVSLCRRLRSQKYTLPILILTARSLTQDKVAGLDAGADDYLVKPFEVPELMARIRSLLRRESSSAEPLLTWGQLMLDPSSCEVKYDQELINVSPKEYALLELFLRNPKRVYSQGDILEHLWTYEDPPGLDTVRAHVKGLRRKLKSGGAPDPIKTVYGLGYALNDLPSSEQENTSKPEADPDPSKAQQQTLEAINKAWERYKPKHFQRLQTLEQAVMMAQAQQLDHDQLKSAQKEAHKLAGSLGTFGFTEGSDLARRIESLWESYPEAQEIQQLASLIKALRQTMEQPTELTSDPPPQLELTPQPGSKILVVDDDPTVLTALELILNPWGLTVITLNQSTEFWPTLLKTKPDLIIMDVELNDQNGIELCQQVRDHDEWSWIPILFLTAHTDASTLHQVFTAGGDDFVTKPMVGPELLTRLFNRLDRTRLLQRVAAQGG